MSAVPLRPLLALGAALVLVSGCSNDQAVPDAPVSSSPPASDSAPSPSPTSPSPSAPTPPLPAPSSAAEGTIVSAGDDPQWCGPVATYVSNAAQRGSQAAEGGGDLSEAARLNAQEAAAAAAAPGVPADVASQLSQVADVFREFAESGRATPSAEDQERASSLDVSALATRFQEECPETLASIPAPS